MRSWSPVCASLSAGPSHRNPFLVTGYDKERSSRPLVSDGRRIPPCTQASRNASCGPELDGAAHVT
jgi:hypothetical protein